MNRTSLLLSILTLALLVSAHALESKPAPPPRKATAVQLIADAKRALAYIGKLAQESTDKSLDPKNIRQKPFWASVKESEELVLLIEKELKSHDLAFFEAINASTQSAAELRGALPRSGIKNPKLETGVKSLCNTLILLRKNYGVEGLRKKRGGVLTEQEQADFAKLKDAEKALVAQMEALLVDVKSNAHLSAELTRLIAKLKKSIDAPMSVDELNAALELVDVVDGEWESYSFYVDPKNRKAWNNTRLADTMKAVDAFNKQSMVDLTVPDWNFVDEPIEYTPPADAEFEVFFEVNEVDGYIAYISKNVNDVELEVYYQEVTTDDSQDAPIQELNDD